MAILSRKVTQSPLVILGQPDGHLSVKVMAQKKVIEPKMNSQPFPLDLAAAIKGMYRLLDLINESGSNGYGKEPS